MRANYPSHLIVRTDRALMAALARAAERDRTSVSAIVRRELAAALDRPGWSNSAGATS